MYLSVRMGYDNVSSFLFITSEQARHLKYRCAADSLGLRANGHMSIIFSGLYSQK
jgi:hypothetical protein